MPERTLKTHPLTGQLITPLGVVGGRIVWPIMGGSEPSPEPEPNPAPEPEPEPEPTPDDTDWAKEARKWEQRAKGNKGKADQLDALLKVLNPDGGAPDPQKISSDLDAARRASTETQIENTVLKLALKNGADAVRLTDSRSFMAKVSNLDPAASDFESKVKAAIAKAVEDDGSLKSSAGPKPNPYQGQNGGQPAKLARGEEGKAEAERRFGIKQ